MRWLFYLLIFIAFVGCKAKQSLADVEYVKVLSFGRAETITAYNKGLGLYAYAFFQPKNDSLVKRVVTDINENAYVTWSGKLGNPAYTDTINRLLAALKKYPNPITFDTTYTGDTYCGPELYVEYKDKKGIHYYDFILNHDDTLNQFCHFFNRLEALPWPKRVVDNKVVNVDEEAVTAVKRLGFYEKREAPYIPLVCEGGIAKSKIYGVWRQIGIYPESHMERFIKLTINKNGTWIVEKIREGKTMSRREGRFTLSPKENTFVMKFDGGKEKSSIIKLSDNCFECKTIGRDYSVRYDRLIDQKSSVSKVFIK